MDGRILQQRLISGGYAIGTVDGVIGPKTLTALLAHLAGRPMSAVAEIAAALAKYAPQFGLLDSASRLANFSGQACHETGNFRFLREIWGPTPTQTRYEGRADLGNTQPGDGKRFMGRGIFQLTGRANYKDMAIRTGLPLLEQPELVEQPDTAVLTACIFWKARKLSNFADAGQDDTITRRINGGTNGIDERRRLVGMAKGLMA